MQITNMPFPDLEGGGKQLMVLSVLRHNYTFHGFLVALEVLKSS